MHKIKKLLAKLIFGTKLVGVFEEVSLRDVNGNWHKLKAKIDTGAFGASIDENLAHKLNLFDKTHPVEKIYVSNVYGKKLRKRIPVWLKINDQEIKTSATLTDRAKMKYPMLIGRSNVPDFVITYNPAEARKLRNWLC